MSQRVRGWSALCLLLAALGAGYVSSGASAQENPAPTELIGSIEVTRPGNSPLRVSPSSERESLALVESPPQCEASRPLTLLRAGCPAAAPDVTACTLEGLECRYETAGDCVARYECLYGLWSPLDVACRDAEPGLLLAGSGPCEDHTPVADAPCADEGVSCGHRSCGFADFYQVIAECRCGRWYQRWQQCPLTR